MPFPWDGAPRYTHPMDARPDRSYAAPRPGFGLRATLVLAPAALGIALAPLRTGDSSTVVALLMAAAVALTAVRLGRNDGLIAGVLGALVFDLLHVPPYGTLAVDHPEDVASIFVLALIGGLVGELAERGRGERALRRRRDAELTEIRGLLELGAAHEPPGRLVKAAVDAVQAATGVACQYEAAPFLDRLPELHHSSLVVPAGDPGPLATRNLVQVPVGAGGRVIGRLVLELPGPAPGMALDPERRAIVVSIADQLGAALDRAG